MPFAEEGEHAFQCFRSIVDRKLAGCSLHRNAHKAEFQNGRSEKCRSATGFHYGNPRCHPPVICVIHPTPSHQHIHVQQVFHGKSESISRTDSVVKGGWLGNGAKIIAPVNSHRTRVNAAGFGPTPPARCLRYSERLNFALFDKERIFRASSSVTLKLSVFIGNTVLL
jgi:hypothetical protein